MITTVTPQDPTHYADLGQYVAYWVSDDEQNNMAMGWADTEQEQKSLSAHHRELSFRIDAFIEGMEDEGMVE